MAAVKSHVFESVIDKQTPHAVAGKGIMISVEQDGKNRRDVIDAMSGAAVASLGWGDEDVYDIVNEAIRGHTYTYPLFIGNDQSEELSEFYIKNSPEGAFSSAFFCCSGSESNENALRIMRQYQIERGRPEKVKIISREQSYHGFTLGAMSISSGTRSDKYKDILVDQDNICLKMPACYSYRYQKPDETEEQYSERLLQKLEEIILENDPDTISSVIVETLPGSSLGTTPPTKGYLSGMRKLCDKYDIIFMLDEVMCGTGRCNPNGKLNCWENYLEPGQAPDIQTVGKTLGSGYVTIAGVLVGPKIKDTIVKGSGTVGGSHTYASHGFNCAVALGIQKKIQRENLTSNIFKMGNLMGELLKKSLLKPGSIVGDVRGIGGFWSFEFVKNTKTKEPFPSYLELGYRFHKLCFENGVSVMGMHGIIDGTSGDLALLAPAFIITEKDVHLIVDKVTECVELLTQQLKSEGEF